MHVVVESTKHDFVKAFTNGQIGKGYKKPLSDTCALAIGVGLSTVPLMQNDKADNQNETHSPRPMSPWLVPFG